MVRVNRKRAISYLLIGALVAVSLMLVAIPTDTLIGYVGTENVFLFMFLIAFVGSLSTFASIPYPLILIGLAAGGFNPLLLGLTSATGVIMADSLTFLVTKRGRTLISENTVRSVDIAAAYIKKYPRMLPPGLVLYGTMSPLSNDFAVISLSLMKYKYIRVIPFLALGNIFYNVAIAYFGVYVYDWIINLF